MEDRFSVWFVGRGSPSGHTSRCRCGLRGSLIWPGQARGCTLSSGMGLCGLGLLGDNLSKILGRAGGAGLWRPSQTHKTDLAPGHSVPRPGSAERPALLPPRSLGGSVAGWGTGNFSWWVGGLQMAMGLGWRVWGCFSKEAQPWDPTRCQARALLARPGSQQRLPQTPPCSCIPTLALGVAEWDTLPGP